MDRCRRSVSDLRIFKVTAVMGKKDKSLKERAANVIHGIILVGFIIYVFISIACDSIEFKADSTLSDNLKILKIAVLNMTYSQIFTFIGAIAFVLFGFAGIYDFAYMHGINWLAPPLYQKCQENKLQKQAQIMMSQYYRKEIENIREYEKERAEYLLQLLGLKNNQFSHIRYEIIKARALKCTDKIELESKAEALIYNTQCIKDLSKIPEEDRAYSDVIYYLDLYSAFYDSKLCSDFAKIMYTFIVQTLGETSKKIDYIIVPQGSNLLLGLEVGRKFEAKVIAIQEKGRIQKSIPWDGTFFGDVESNPKHVLILHDVLVSGKRLDNSLELLDKLESDNIIPENSYKLEGVFCIAYYEREKIKSFEELELNYISEDKCHCLITVSEEKLKAAIEIGGE